MPAIKINNLTWHFEECGHSSNPPVLLLHGFSGCASMWQGIMDELSGDYRCIAPDLPGHGSTIVPMVIDHFQLTSVADAIAALLKAMDIGTTVVWGYSMGGRLALQFALRHPELVNRLILESASPGLAEPAERVARCRSDNELADRILQIGTEKFVDDWMTKPLFAESAKLPQVTRQRARQLRLRNTPDGLAMSLRGMGTGAQEPLHGELQSVGVPTLIVVGERDEKFTTIGQAMVNIIPDSRISIITNAGHAPYWEQPEATTGAVRVFLGSDNTT